MCLKLVGGPAAVLHSPLIKSLLIGSEEDHPPFTVLTPTQVVKENYFCRRTNMPFSSEILIGINIRRAADWLAPQRSGGDKGSMSNDGQAAKYLQNMAKLF